MEQTPDSYLAVTRYFPDLTDTQIDALRQLGDLYTDWNEKINVISRADTANLYTRHILHSLAIAKFLGPLKSGTSFFDLGTGGGFPGIPLAIFYPDCTFHLIDRIGKKIKVASSIAEAIGLKNVTFQHGDSGECRQKFDYTVSRAVMTLDQLLKACSKNIKRNAPAPGAIPQGLVCLKGGDLGNEIAQAGVAAQTVAISNFFPEQSFFDTKDIVYVNLSKS